MIGKGLSLDQSPPIKINFVFFSIALLFAITGSIYLIINSSNLFLFWFSNSNITWIHFFTLGFINLTVIGALMQLFPVVVASKVQMPRGLLFITLGVYLCGVFIFLGSNISLSFRFIFSLKLSFILIGGSILVFLFYFLGAAFTAEKNSISMSMVLSLISLCLVFILAVFSALGYTYVDKYKVLPLHVSWALAGYLGMLISAIAYKVIPMFFVTLEYPLWFKKFFPYIIFISLLLLSVSYLFSLATFFKQIFYSVIIISYSTFAIITLKLLYYRKRKKREPVVLLWQVSMLCLLFANALAFYGVISNDLFSQLKMVMGVLFIFGFVVSVMLAMILKIVPFLSWYHLFASGKSDAPNMSELISVKEIKRIVTMHIIIIVLLTSISWLALTKIIVGVLLLVNFSLVFYYLIRTSQVYKRLKFAHENSGFT